MKEKTKLMSLGLALVVGVSSLVTSYSSRGQSVLSTISDVAAPGGFNYTILLQNTGTTNLNSFWYGWTQGGNNLPPSFTASGLTNSQGWGNSVLGNSIEWVNTTGTALAPGQTGSFFFFSSSTPAAMTTSPSGESVAYVHGITFSQNLPGDSTGIFSPTLVPAPEPSPAALLAIGSLGLMGVRRLQLRARR